MTKTYHTSCNIDGLLRAYKGRKINVIEDDNGKILSDKEARQQLQNLKNKGYKLIPLAKCEGFDPFGSGCPGHEVKE